MRTVSAGTGTPGKCWFPNGEPKEKNWSARHRVQDLTIYDSQNDHGIWLERGSTTTIRPSTLPGAIFCLVAVICLIVTWTFL